MAVGQSINKIPEEPASELEQLAGPKKRTAFAVDVLWREVRRNEQIEALQRSKGSWKAEDDPELAHGAAAYVEQNRGERDQRFSAIEELEKLERSSWAKG